MTEKRSAYLSLFAGVAAISVSALMVRQVTMAPTVSAFWRVFYAAIMIYTVYSCRRIADKGKTRRNYSWIIPAFLAGVFLAIDLVIWHKTIIDIGAGPATFLGNSQVIFVTIFGAVIFREKIGKAFLLAFPVALTGLYLLVPSFMTGGLRSMAYVMGLTVGLTYAGFLICLRYAKQASPDEYPEALSLSFIMLVTALIIAAWGVYIERVALITGSVHDHLAMAAIALVANTFGWMLIKTNITRIPAHQGSLLLLMQPVLTMVWAGLFFGEAITPMQLSGAVMVIAAIAGYQMTFDKSE